MRFPQRPHALVEVANRFPVLTLGDHQELYVRGRHTQRFGAFGFQLVMILRSHAVENVPAYASSAAFGFTRGRRNDTLLLLGLQRIHRSCVDWTCWLCRFRAVFDV